MAAALLIKCLVVSCRVVSPIILQEGLGVVFLGIPKAIEHLDREMLIVVFIINIVQWRIFIICQARRLCFFLRR